MAPATRHEFSSAPKKPYFSVDLQHDNNCYFSPHLLGVPYSGSFLGPTICKAPRGGLCTLLTWSICSIAPRWCSRVSPL